MSSEKDLLDTARTSTDDFYSLLNLEPSADESAIKSAYRKTALKYHPDKHPGNQEIIEKWHVLSTAYAVLLDPAAREAYDKARVGRKEKELRERKLDANRKAMKDALERAEGSFKRKAQDDLDDQERKIRRIAEENRRRREEQDRRRQEEEAEATKADADVEVEPATKAHGGNQVPEIDRTVKVRWVREGEGKEVEKEKLLELFSKFGKVDNVVVMKDRKVKVEGEKHRRIIANGLIIYSSIVSAHVAISDALSTFPFLEAVFWASKEPEIKSPLNQEFSASVPSTPTATPKTFRASFPGISKGGFGSSLGSNGKPSFSFSPKSPSLEEVTMMRLKQKQAEKKRLEEQIRKEEAAAEG